MKKSKPKRDDKLFNSESNTGYDMPYKAILDSYEIDVNSEDLLKVLHCLAAAKDFLSVSHLKLILKMNEFDLNQICSKLKDVLKEIEYTDRIIGYKIQDESFREYLHREKSNEIMKANELILDFCSTWKLLKERWEQRYALEHYASHLFESNKMEHWNRLTNLIHDNDYLLEQKNVLKNDEPCNHFFGLALDRSSQLKSGYLFFETTFSKLDFKSNEAKIMFQIFDLVSKGDVDKGLELMDTVDMDGHDKIRIIFLLYMACLLELTLLEGKEKPFRKSAIKKILAHLDKHLPIDHSLLNWKDFYSSYIMFQMACVWAEMGLDYMVIYNRTNDWEKDWIAEKGGNYSKIHFKVLFESANGISDEVQKVLCLIDISSELSKQECLKEADEAMLNAIKYAYEILDEKKRSSALSEVSIKLSKHGKFLEALEMASDISDVFYKCFAFSEISTNLLDLGCIEDADKIVHNVLVTLEELSNENEKNKILSIISTSISRLDKIEEALFTVNRISDESLKCSTLANISTALNYLGNIDQANIFMQKAINIGNGIRFQSSRNQAFCEISLELSKQRKLDETLAMMEMIDDKRRKFILLRDLAFELFKNGEHDAALIIADGISSEMQRSNAFRKISTELYRQGKIEVAEFVMHKALIFARKVQTQWKRNFTMHKIAVELAKMGKFEVVNNIMLEILSNG